MTRHIFLGIDPGNSGAICALAVWPHKTQIEFIDNNDSVMQLNDWLFKIEQSKVTMCMIENVHSVPQSSAKANFTFGWNVGMLHTLLKLRTFGYDMVNPKMWQKAVGVSVPIQFKGTERKKRIKNQVAEICERIYPGCEIRGPKGGLKDGRSDALMIAHYCRLKYKL